MFNRSLVCLSCLCCTILSIPSLAQNTRTTPAYRQMKSYLDAIPAIDTQDFIVMYVLVMTLSLVGVAIRRASVLERDTEGLV